MATTGLMGLSKILILFSLSVQAKQLQQVLFSAGVEVIAAVVPVGHVSDLIRLLDEVPRLYFIVRFADPDRYCPGWLINAEPVN